MDLKEKLDIFFDASIEAAKHQSQEIRNEYEQTFNEDITEYKKTSEEAMMVREKIGEAKIRKEVNRRVSEQMVALRRCYHEEEEKKIELLFEQVMEKLKNYQSTEEYELFLAKKIMNAKKVAKQEPILIYLNASDADKKQRLEEKTGCELTISNEDFVGGIRGVIRSRNILIDESFSSKITALREQYSF